jgi:hypothetical protein
VDKQISAQSFSLFQSVIEQLLIGSEVSEKYGLRTQAANAAVHWIAGIETNFANETNLNNQYDTLTNED